MQLQGIMKKQYVVSGSTRKISGMRKQKANPNISGKINQPRAVPNSTFWSDVLSSARSVSSPVISSKSIAPT